MATTEQTNPTPSVDLLKSQDPQEVLGMESSGSFLQAMGLSVLVSVLLVGAFTVGPYAVGNAFSSSDPEKSETAKKKDNTPQSKPAPVPPKKADNPPSDPTKTAGTGQPSIDKGTLDKLNMSETKNGTPNSNPLGSKPGSDILSELDK